MKGNIYVDIAPCRVRPGLWPRFLCLTLTSLHRAGGFWDRGQEHGRWRFAVSVPRSTALLAHPPVCHTSTNTGKPWSLIIIHSFYASTRKISTDDAYSSPDIFYVVYFLVFNLGLTQILKYIVASNNNTFYSIYNTIHTCLWCFTTHYYLKCIKNICVYNKTNTLG